MATLSPLLEDLVQRLASQLKILYGTRYRGLVLFGSYARGEADSGSDIDLLLLLDGPVAPDREIVRIEPIKCALALEAGITLSVLPDRRDDFERGERLFLRNARREGILARLVQDGDADFAEGREFLCAAQTCLERPRPPKT